MTYDKKLLIEGFALLQDTEIGKAVNGLRRHGSDEIRELAKALFAYEFNLSFVMCFKLWSKRIKPAAFIRDRHCFDR